MKKLLIVIYQFSLSLAVPKYGPVGVSYCRNDPPYYFATSFFARTYQQAETRCNSYDCDLIVEWEGPLGQKTTKGWDVGKFGNQQCEQNKKMKAKVVWEKSFNRFNNETAMVSDIRNGKFSIYPLSSFMFF